MLSELQRCTKSKQFEAPDLFTCFAGRRLSARVGEKMKEFGGGEGDPDEAVGDDESAKDAPDGEAGPVKRRRNVGFAGDDTRTSAGPAFPEGV